MKPTAGITCRSGWHDKSKKDGQCYWYTTPTRRVINEALIGKEDNLDVVIGLRRPDSYRASEGARFIVEYTKCRSLFGERAEPFEARLVDQGAPGSPSLTWEGRAGPGTDDTYSQVRRLMQEGCSQQEVATRLSKNRSTINRHWNRARMEGGAMTAPMPAMGSGCCTVALPSECNDATR